MILNLINFYVFSRYALKCLLLRVCCRWTVVSTMMVIAFSKYMTRVDNILLLKRPAHWIVGLLSGGTSERASDDAVIAVPPLNLSEFGKCQLFPTDRVASGFCEEVFLPKLHNR